MYFGVFFHALFDVEWNRKNLVRSRYIYIYIVYPFIASELAVEQIVTVRLLRTHNFACKPIIQ